MEVEKVPEETKQQLELMQARIRELEASITQLMAIQDEEKKIRCAPAEAAAMYAFHDQLGGVR